MSKLFVVPTPIGNLKDITLRALEILNSVNNIICEDTRKTTILLNKYQIKNKKLISYYAPKEDKKIPYLINLLKKESCALVVDAGTPGISDPGYKLIKACLENNIEIEVLPGPTAFLTALIGSGLPTDRFLFLGFLPKKGLEKFLKKFIDLDVTIVFYESSQRILNTLKIIEKIIENCNVVIAREISKIYEEYIRGELKGVIKLLENKKLKGELTIVIRKF